MEGQPAANSRLLKCPEIQIKIEGIDVKALVDTGSEITCISQEFYEKHANEFRDKPTLPISGKLVKGATGGKAQRLKRQVLLNTQIEKSTVPLIFIVVPKLIKDCIIGYDTQKGLKMLIDTSHDEIQYAVNNSNGIISYKIASLNHHSYQSMRIEYDRIDEFNLEPSDSNLCPEEILNLTLSEVDKKVNECQNLDDAQRTTLRNLFWKYRQVFRKQPGLFNTYTHKLSLSDSLPFFTKPYPVPMNYKTRVQDEVNKMLKLNIVRHSTSPYINPVAVVTKKDGSVRLCLDARKLNAKLYKDHESPPSIDSIFQRCDKIKFMSTMDLTSSFWQVALDENSKKYTAFMVDNKVLEFNVVPFGLSTSSAALIRALDFAIGDLHENIIPFVDDLLCVSKTYEEHIEHLIQLFERAIKCNFTLSFKKSNFLRDEVQFLGHIISKEGVRPQPDKIEAIMNFETPRNVLELQSFLGFLNFFSKFMRFYAQETVPLLPFLRKDAAFVWDRGKKETLQRLKQIFSENLVLKFADPRKPYILTTDASEYAIGAMLTQFSSLEPSKGQHFSIFPPKKTCLQ